MCYFAFVRYQCGCAPLDPILVPSSQLCPSACRDRSAPSLNTTNYQYLSYNCNNCQSHRGLLGRPYRAREGDRDGSRRVESRTVAREREREREPRAVSARTVAASGDPGRFVDIGEGRFRRKTFQERKEDERVARRMEWAENSRRRQRERDAEEEEEEERRKAAERGVGRKESRSGRK